MAQPVLSVSEFGGYPFLDEGFARDRLLVAVACARWVRVRGDVHPRPADLHAMLNPDQAVRVRQLDLELPLESHEFDPDHLRRIDAARDAIRAAIPSWGPLLDVPWRYRRLPEGRGAIGASTFAWPQHVFLAEAAFASEYELVEQIVHELSHGWLYLLEELAPLQHEGCTRLITLPSGTSERGVNELLGALHVVANLRNLWAAVAAPDELRTRRLAVLDRYWREALELLPQAEPCMTREGSALAERLREEAA